MKRFKACHIVWISGVAAGLLLSAGGWSFLVPGSPMQSAAQARPAPPAPFDERLLEIAKNYLKYGRVDDEMRVAPAACAAPANLKPGIARFSKSDDAQTHGNKLYSVFAANKWIYQAAKDQKEQPIGQVVVKQSWVADEVKDEKDKERKVIVTRVKLPPKDTTPKELASGERIDHFLPYAEKNGKVYRASKQAELFIMFKVDPKTKDTDNGWVYGTVTADGKKVTSAGQVQSCMKCHQDAPHDKLFGLPEKN
ncbi:MAG: cytochrome P460 family protein [Gemmataceae bacterium]